MLLYCTVMLKPLLPLINDAWSHSFAEASHIMTVHAKYGSNHLSKELAKGSDASNKNQNTLTSQEQVFVHLLTGETKYTFTLNFLNKNYNPYNPSSFPSIFIFKEGPPPKS